MRGTDLDPPSDFLSNYKFDDYEDLIQNMILNYQKRDNRMSFNIYFLNTFYSILEH